MSEFTERYNKNQDCIHDYNIRNEDTYQYGCEFEFYVNEDKDFNKTIDELKDRLFKLCNTDILINRTSIPDDEDKNYCLQIKRDGSLKENGIEISVPICNLQGIKYYITNIFSIIEEIGYTNSDTGLHFHISTVEKDGVNIPFFSYALACNDKALLDSWDVRMEYSHNVMDVIDISGKADARKKKNRPIWNLEKRGNNHIEIKTMGGNDYHKQIEKVISEFEQYANCFNEVHKNSNSKYVRGLIIKHVEKLKGYTSKQKAAQIKNLQSAGLVEK